MQYPPERLMEIGFTAEETKKKPELYRARGCTRCSNGYNGRFAILEALTVTDRVKRIILEGKTEVEIKLAAIDEGMITLRRCGLLNALRGRTSIEEVLRMTADDVVETDATRAKKAKAALAPVEEPVK
jgi:type IV pilus assembly protein PilB